jgi:hypothetical protein
MYVTLLSDVEDILAPEADDITLTIAELVEREGARATFCVTGDRILQWRDRGRHDVLSALGRHDVGFHTMHHSLHPTILEYLADREWDDGVEEVARQEGPGIEALAATFGAPASCYGGPGNSWGPQVNGAMARFGVPAVVYAHTRVPRGDVHLFCGRICYPGGYCLQDGAYHDAAAWEKDVESLMTFLSQARADGRQWVEVYIGHPSRILHDDFWDVHSFTAGRMPPPSQWAGPQRKSDADLSKALAALAETIRRVTAAPGVTLKTIREMNALFASAAEERLTASEIAEAREATEANLDRMARWIILPPDLDLSRIQRLTREKAETLRRLRLG